MYIISSLTLICSLSRTLQFEHLNILYTHTAKAERMKADAIAREEILKQRREFEKFFGIKDEFSYYQDDSMKEKGNNK